jgi:hypothetical protein
MAVIPIYIPTYINSADYTPAKVQPRLLFYNGQRDCEKFYIKDSNNSSREVKQFPYFDNYNVVEGSFPTTGSKSLLFYNEESVYGETPYDSVYTDYWSRYLSLIYNPKTKLLNASAIIPLADYFHISQNDIVQFRGNYYHLRGINDYNLKNGECSIQLLGPILPGALNLPSKGYPYCFGYDVTNCYIACNTACECNPPCPTSTTTTTAAPTTTTTSTTSTTTSTTTTTTVGPLVIEYIIVAGGGSGGGTSYGWSGDPGVMRVWPGGGGGGQVITGSMTVLNPLTIGVGEGGQNTFYVNNPLLVPTYPTGVNFFSGSHGSMGFPSYISGSSILQVAIGGGQGGTSDDPNFTGYPIPTPKTQFCFGGTHSNGGNGGGAAIVSASLPQYQIVSGGLSTGGGFNGAWSTGSTTLGLNNAGGGAGAGANGSGANGGNGYVWLDGNTYAGGGAGMNFDGTYSFICSQGCPPGTTGTPGAGGGGTFNTDGTQNTGGGGGASFSAFYPANGGKGVVKIRYIGTPRATGGTITQSGGYTYHTFTSNLQGGAYIVGAVSGSGGITGGTYRFDAQQPNNGNYQPAYTASFIPN